MRIHIVKYGNKSNIEALEDLLRHGYNVIFSTPLKDEIHYILEYNNKNN